MLMRFDPFRDVDRVFDQSLGQSRKNGGSMPLDAYRHDDKFIVEVDLPGVDAGSIDVSVEKNVLTIAAQRRRVPNPERDFVVTERPQGLFSRQLFLGEALDADSVTAAYADGVLTIAIPVSERAKPRKIEVTHERNEPSILAESTLTT